MSLRNPPVDDAQLELFSAIFTDIASRDAREVMEFPFLSLSKKPRFTPIAYVSPSGTKVTVSGGEPFGIANIWDYDLVIWVLSQLRKAIDSGQEVSRKVRFTRHGYLKAARRHTSGYEYKRLEESILRLKNTTIVTSIRPRGKKATEAFNWFENAKLEYDENDKFLAATVLLPEWLFHAVCDHKLVLALHQDYFLLKKSYEKWLYRLCRKSAGNKAKGWEWKLRTLHKRSGTTREYKKFAFDIRKIVADSPLLDYELTLRKARKEEYLHAVKCVSTEVTSLPEDPPSSTGTQFLRVSGRAIERAKCAAPGYDVYVLYELWKEYNEKKKSTVKDSDKAFVGFCKKYQEKNPIPAR